jgi:hypothetical protein
VLPVLLADRPVVRAWFKSWLLGIDKRASAVKRRPKYGVLWLRVSTEGTKWPAARPAYSSRGWRWVSLADLIWKILGTEPHPVMFDSFYGPWLTAASPVLPRSSSPRR